MWRWSKVYLDLVCFRWNLLFTPRATFIYPRRVTPRETFFSCVIELNVSPETGRQEAHVITSKHLRTKSTNEHTNDLDIAGIAYRCPPPKGCVGSAKTVNSASIDTSQTSLPIFLDCSLAFTFHQIYRLLCASLSE